MAPSKPTKPVKTATPARPRRTSATSSSVALVPVPKPDTVDDLPDPRLSDVDEWGRSQKMRELAHKVYAPLYERWHRVEWEGMENIPTTGGALLVSNHAGAIPADAPAI